MEQNNKSEDARGRLLLVGVAVLGALLLVLHGVAQAFFLYWEYRWLDIPMHFLGGMWVALLALYGVFYTRTGKRYVLPVTNNVLLIMLGGTLLFGIAWEVYELFFKFLGWGWFPESYVADTVLDVVMDMCGGVTAWLLLHCTTVCEKEKRTPET